MSSLREYGAWRSWVLGFSFTTSLFFLTENGGEAIRSRADPAPLREVEWFDECAIPQGVAAGSLRVCCKPRLASIPLTDPPDPVNAPRLLGDWNMQVKTGTEMFRTVRIVFRQKTRAASALERKRAVTGWHRSKDEIRAIGITTCEPSSAIEPLSKGCLGGAVLRFHRSNASRS